ncbi:MAG TPA: DUF1611 domain-containing protein [Steroidobacteraceae bacterium]|nr:DUF1611 domain-containing protein [Steroidobacteraceae bacterium]
MSVVHNAAATGDASGPLVTRLPSPYLLFLGDVTDPTYAKTAFGLRDWARERCIGELSCGGGTVTTGLPRLTPAEARARGARALVIGIANEGGRIVESWIPSLVSALEAGLDIVSGMHARLEDTPGLKSVAERHGRRLINVRTPPRGIPIGTGAKRSGKRLLTVGTDCALGKKYTALALTRAFRARGIDVDFRATGQTGIMIAGTGMPMDAVVADFEAGAAELLSPEAAPDHWDVIEGQGSLFHPAYAGVTLALVHGSQPDVLILCHDPTRPHIHGFPDFPIPDLPTAATRYLEAARLTNPGARLGGVSLNTSMLDESQRDRVIAETADRLGVPCFDPLQTPLKAALDFFLPR